MTRDEARRILLAGGEVELDGLLYRLQCGRLQCRRLKYRSEWKSSTYGGDIDGFLRKTFPGPRSQEEIDAEIAGHEKAIERLKAERGERPTLAD